MPAYRNVPVPPAPRELLACRGFVALLDNFVWRRTPAPSFLAAPEPSSAAGPVGGIQTTRLFDEGAFDLGGVSWFGVDRADWVQAPIEWKDIDVPNDGGAESVQTAPQ